MVRVIANVRWHHTRSAMRRTASLVIEGAIVLGVAVYFAVEGFSGNSALTVGLAVVGLASLALFIGVLLEPRGQGR
jgi:hypothetical protein